MIPKSARGLLLTALLASVSIPILPIIPRILPHPVNAVSFTLWGRFLTPSGWGFSSSTVANPGPSLNVAAGSSVTLSLFSGDGAGHTFCVDYNADGACNNSEPLSPLFSSSTTPLPFTFTATTTPGTYTYFCTIHGAAAMRGSLVVSPVHDVAVTGVSTSRNFAYSGVSGNPVQVAVTAANLGSQSESFWVAALANATLIGNTTITNLAAAQSQTVLFSWAASALARGSYNLIGQVQVVQGETATSNNVLTINNGFTVKFKGDVNGDCIVDVSDLAIVGAVFGKSSGQSGFNSAADINNDNVIDVSDLAVVGSVFGQHC